jgi:acetolactate synthase regulatory subunit
MKMFATVLILCVVVIGFHRGWFTLSSNSAGTADGKVNINLTVDPDKAKQDAEEVKDKATALGGRATEAVKANGK